jgi:integrase
MDLKPLLERENRRLDRCRLLQVGQSLRLRATLPDRLDPAQRRQTTIGLGLPAIPASLERARQLARRLDDQLVLGGFAWAEWEAEALREPAGERSLRYEDLVEAVQALWRLKQPDTAQSSATAWGKKYQPVLKLLELRKGPCSEAALLRLLRAIPSPSARKSAASIVRQAVVNAGLPLDRNAISEAGQGYTRQAINPRDIPSDGAIEAGLERIELPHWRWMYGMVWLFGIRPHEIVSAQLSQRDGKYILQIGDDTKTGARESWAVPNSKIEQHGLQRVHRPPQDKDHVTQAAALYLSSSKSNGRGGRRQARLPFSLYALRHAYAIRLLVAGWPAEVGARLMGHSPAMHTETYQRWVNAQHMEAMHERFRDRLE